MSLAPMTLACMADNPRAPNEMMDGVLREILPGML